LPHIFPGFEALFFDSLPQSREEPGGGLNPGVRDQKRCFQLFEERLVNPRQAEEPSQLPAGSAQTGSKTLDPSGPRRF
jgi:hypothetical protein